MSPCLLELPSLRDQGFTRGAQHRNTQDSRACLAVLRGTYTPDMPWTDDLPRPELND
jgi:hypothetical protein